MPKTKTHAPVLIGTGTAPKAYSYIRFSTPEQMEGDSERRQIEGAQRYAEREGLTLDKQLRYDKGISAFHGKNVGASGQLGIFLEAMKSGLVAPGSYLIVESLDRLSRQNVLDTLSHIFLELINGGITIVTLSPEQVYKRETLIKEPWALFGAMMIMMRANEDSTRKSDLLRKTWGNKRATIKERPLTSKAPSWLKLDKRAGQFRVIEERAKVVRRIFQMTLDGIGQHTITKTFNQEGIPVFGRAEDGWPRSYIVKILASPAVIGTFIPHEIEHKDGKRLRKAFDPVPNYYPAIVDKGTFNRVQTLRSKKAPLRGRHAAAGIVRNLFSNLALCPKCGGAMSRVYKGKPPKGGAYLVCSAARAGVKGKSACRATTKWKKGEPRRLNYHAVRYDRVENAFLRDIEQLTNTVPAGKEGEKIDRALSQAEGALDAVTDQLVKLIRQAPSPRRDRERRVAESTRDQLEQECETLRGQQAEIAGPAIEQRLEELREATSIKPLDRLRVNALLRQLLAGVVVDYTSGALVLNWKHGGESLAVFGMPEVRGKGRTIKKGIRIQPTQRRRK